MFDQRLQVRPLDRGDFHGIALSVATLSAGMRSERWLIGGDLSPEFFDELISLRNQIQRSFLKSYGDTSYVSLALEQEPKQASLYVLQNAIGCFLASCATYQHLLPYKRLPDILVTNAEQALSSSMDLLQSQLGIVHQWISDFDRNKLGVVSFEQLTAALVVPHGDPLV